MNMGARFGVAVLAGLILGVAIVAGASFASSGSANFSAVAPAYQSRSVATTSTATTTTAVPTLNIANQTQQSSGASSLSGSIASIPNTSQNGLLSSGSPAVASQLVTIVHQPLQSIVVLLPVLAAVLFGFILYRASRIRTEEEKPTS
jgi:hypothetical protein